jgi:hypothetical protein
VLVAGFRGAGAGGYAALIFLEVPLLLGIGVAVGFAAGWGYNGLFLYAVVRLHPQAPARTTGIAPAGAFAGGVIGPPLFGLIGASMSYATAWAFLRREWGYGAYMLATLAVLMTSTWYFSIPRMLLSLFPAMVFMSGWTREHPGRHDLMVLVMAPVATLGVIVFTRGAWFY